jgi:hypothetical protein
MKQLRILKPVTVVWRDIFDDGPSWQDGDTQLNPITVRTTGYLLSDNAKHIVIVRDYYDHQGRRTLGGRVAIPKGCIDKISYLVTKPTKV